MFIKNKKGFTLIEILVSMGLVGVLAAIAVPAYDSYRSRANETVLKSDSSNAYKAYHAYNAVHNTFCADLDTVGLKALTNSETYTGKDKYFVGFAGKTTGECGAVTGSISAVHGSTPPSMNRADCKVGSSDFKFSVINYFSGKEVGFSVDSASNAPTQGGPFCHKTGDLNTVHSNCTSANCATAHTCNSQVAGTWTTGRLCQ